MRWQGIPASALQTHPHAQIESQVYANARPCMPWPEALTTDRRVIYVTPRAFLELIGSFKRALALRRGDVGTLRGRLQRGLEALRGAAVAVEQTEKELIAKRPVLEQTKRQAARSTEVGPTSRGSGARSAVERKIDPASASHRPSHPMS